MWVHQEGIVIGNRDIWLTSFSGPGKPPHTEKV